MRNLLLFTLILIDSDFKLPNTWTKDFKIVLYTTPGMKDEAVNITYTFDSCEYVKREGTIKKTTAFALTTSQKNEILKKLTDLKIDKIKSIKSQKKPMMDESSSGICFYDTKEFCLGGGSITNYNEQDSKNYSIAYNYLLEFAEPKKK